MAENKKTKTEKLKEEEKVTGEELTTAAKKQEQIEQQQLQKVRNWANFLIDNERRKIRIKTKFLWGMEISGIERPTAEPLAC